MTSVSTIDSGFSDSAAVSFKAHHILPNDWGVALRCENALTFRERLDGGRSAYGVVTRVWDTSAWSPLLSSTTSAGIGNRLFRSEEDVREDDGTIDLFVSVGVHVWEPGR